MQRPCKVALRRRQFDDATDSVETQPEVQRP
jgi:hypothetical protein